MLAIGFEKHGSKAELEASPIRHLFEVYVKINAEAEADPTIHDAARAYFKRMEDGKFPRKFFNTPFPAFFFFKKSSQKFRRKLNIIFDENWMKFRWK